MAHKKDPILEKMLADSNKENVALIKDGLTKQHFIELDAFILPKGPLYHNHLLNDDWNKHDESAQIQVVTNEPEKTDQIFETELNQKRLEEARARLSENLSADLNSPSFNSWDFKPKSSIQSSGHFTDYLTQRPQMIKDQLLKRANQFFELSKHEFQDGKYEKAINTLNKAFMLNSFNIQFYLLRCECFVQMCDFRSAILTINKLLSIISVWTEENDNKYDSLKVALHEKIVFCHYMLGQVYFDAKLFLDALDSFNKASELKPDNLVYKIRSISCLFSMNRINDALILLNKIMNESEANQTNSNLYVLRSRLHMKLSNISLCYYDLKSALSYDKDNTEGSTLLEQLRNTGEDLRNSGLILGLNNRLQDAVNKLTGAIMFNPEKADYHLQRGILYKRQRDFNSAIDDFLLGLEKMNHDEQKDPILFNNFQRQILLTYNEFAIQCFEKHFYDDAIVLLNKAIKIEKGEKGFYVNRGDCFFRKNERNFALLDYEQAHEIDAEDESIKDRISKVYYEFGVDKYNEKLYEESTKNFDLAIKFSPKVCKYYISRARTLYFLERKAEAQTDICIAILTDPTNPEIPTIISRIFVNQNLNDVLKSQQMKEAIKRLEDTGIKTVFDAHESLTDQSDEKEKPYHNLQPSFDEFLEEEFENLTIIEAKRGIKASIKKTESTNLKIETPKLKPLPSIVKKMDYKSSKDYNWRKFNYGLAN